MVRSFLPAPPKRGRKPSTDLREVLNALRYLARSGGGWRMLPKDFPPGRRSTGGSGALCDGCCSARSMTWRSCSTVNRRVASRARARPSSTASRSRHPWLKSAALNAAKKVVGRKRHIAVDTDGRLLMVNLTTADISDSAGAQSIVGSIRKRWPWLKHLFADGAYDRTKLMDAVGYRDFVLEIVRRSDAEPGFKVLPRRWVVERTFGWMTRWRRLVRDYEQRLDVSEAMIHLALGSLLLRRIPPSPLTILKRTLRRP
ncbi:IS5 family transposase [Mesorhizobium sp. M0998]